MRIKVRVPDGFAVNADRLARAVRQSLLDDGDAERIWRLNDVPALAQLEEGLYAAGAQDAARAFEQTARVLRLPAETAWLDKALRRKQPAGGGQLALDFEAEHPRLPAGETREGFKPGEFVPREVAPVPVPVPEPEPEADPEPVPPAGAHRGLLTPEVLDYKARLAAWDDRHMTPQLLEARSLEWEDSRRFHEHELTDRWNNGRTEAEDAVNLAALQQWRGETVLGINTFRNRSQAWRDRQAARDRQELGIAGLVKRIEAAPSGSDKRDLERRLNQVYILEEADPNSELNRKNRALREAREERARKLKAIDRYQTPQQIYDQAFKLTEKARQKRNRAVEKLDYQRRTQPLSSEEYDAGMTKIGKEYDRARAKIEALNERAFAINQEQFHWKKVWAIKGGGDGLDGYSGVWDRDWFGYRPPVWEAGRRIDATEGKRLKLPEGTLIYTPQEDLDSRQQSDLGEGFTYVGPPGGDLHAAALKMKAKVLGAVPLAMYARLQAKGVRNVFTAAPPYRFGTQQPSQEAYFENWLSKVKPRSKAETERGFYRSDDLATGVFFSGSKLALTRVGAGVPGGKLGSGSLCTMLHEYGHAVDYNWQESFRLSEEPEFQAIWEACKPHLKPYYFHDAGELFAEGFDHYTESQENRQRLREGPAGYRQLASYFDALFAAAEAPPVSKAVRLVLRVPARKSLASAPGLPGENDVPPEYPFWTATDHDPEFGDICWEGPVLPAEYENLLEDSQPSADMVDEEEEE